MTRSAKFGWVVLSCACLVIVTLLCGRVVGQSPDGEELPAAGDYVPTEMQGVYGGLCYGVYIQQDTSEVYVAAETMRSGFFGAAHDPNNGTWRTTDMGKSWQKIGPGGRNVKVSQQDPNIIYCNGGGGTYKSTDHGKTWNTILPREKGLGYRGLDIFVKDHNIVYAGGSGFLCVSRDGGQTWSESALPKDETGRAARIQVIQIHPTNPDVAFFAFYDAALSGIWKTSDGGKTFEELHRGGSRAMAICYGNPDVIYCSNAVSHDGGKTWRGFQEHGTGAWCIIVHPSNAEVAYYSQPGAPVWRTINGGKSFANILGVEHNLDGTEVEGMAIDVKNDVLWVGGDRIWKGENASTGRIRLVRSDPGFHVNSVADIISTPFSVWAPSDSQGTHFTTDGKTWITNSMGMQAQEALHRIAPSPKNPKIVYAGHERRLYKSEDGGVTWYGIWGGIFPYCKVDPNDENILYISTDSGTGDMVRSMDGGETFQAIGQGTFVAMDGKNNAVYAELPDGLAVSYDHATTFRKISDVTRVGDFFLSPSDPKLMFSARRPFVPGMERPRGDAMKAAKGAKGAKGAKAAQAGATTQATTAPAMPATRPSRVPLPPPELFRSVDGGKTWQKQAIELKGPTRFAEAADGSLWMSDLATGTMRSLDRGQTWEKVWDTMGAMAADPWDKHSLYLATRGGIWWLHPKSVQRPEIIDSFHAIDGELTTIPFNGSIWANRSNATYKLTADVALTGKGHDMVMMPRGLKNVTFDGQGHTVTLAGGNTFFGDDLESITIENFKFVQPTDLVASPVLYLGHARNLTIRNCVFDVTSDFVAGRNGAGVAIGTHGLFTDNVLIENCTFKAPGRSAVINGDGRHTIRNCTFEGNRQTAITLTEADGSVIENNTMAAGGIEVNYSKSIRIAGNTIGAEATPGSLELSGVLGSTIEKNTVNAGSRGRGGPAAALVLKETEGNQLSGNTFAAGGATPAVQLEGVEQPGLKENNSVKGEVVKK